MRDQTRLIFDIETNGLLEHLDRIHCLVVKDADTGEVWSEGNQPGRGDKYIPDLLGMLMSADQVIGHNILTFDIPAIQKIYPWFDIPIDKVFDTLIMSRLIWPEIKAWDFKHRKKNPDFPGQLIGRQGLEAWGWRMGLMKGDYSKQRKEEYIELHGKRPSHDPSARQQWDLGLEQYTWGEWNQDMQDYCVQDVEVNHELLRRIEKQKYSERAWRMEHKFAAIIYEQCQHGFNFNKTEAASLYTTLCNRRTELTDALHEAFPPWEEKTPFTPKRDNKRMGYEKGVTIFKTKTVVFNPGSRDHIAHCLKSKYGWKPTAFTDNGKPKIDETVLSGLDYPEAGLLSEYLLIAKRIGQLAEGKNGWLKVERNSRIHGSVTTVGTPTRRCTHNEPNVAQTPAARSPFGREFRSLFIPDKGHVQVGADASGLELRCLAHYMAKYDGGAYAAEVVDGDVHSLNQAAAGLPTRDTAKTFIYAFLYGAGGFLLGEIVGVTPEEIDHFRKHAKKGMINKARRELKYLGIAATTENICIALKGYQIKDSFLAKTPALAKLQEDVKKKVKSEGALKAVDGGRLSVRSQHSALNTLLQSAGSIAVKLATVYLYEDLSTRGWKWGVDWAQIAHIHDELQLSVRPDYAEEAGKAAVAAIERAGRDLGFRCPLTGEYNIGNSWAETH